MSTITLESSKSHSDRWYLALIPIVYIAAITAICQGEVYGGKQITGVVAIALIITVIGSVICLNVLPSYSLLVALPFIGLFTVLVLPPLIRAAIDSVPLLIQTAVKAGVLSSIFNCARCCYCCGF